MAVRRAAHDTEDTLARRSADAEAGLMAAVDEHQQQVTAAAAGGAGAPPSTAASGLAGDSSGAGADTGAEATHSPAAAASAAAGPGAWASSWSAVTEVLEGGPGAHARASSRSGTPAAGTEEVPDATGIAVDEDGDCSDDGEGDGPASPLRMASPLPPPLRIPPQLQLGAHAAAPSTARLVPARSTASLVVGSSARCSHRHHRTGGQEEDTLDRPLARPASPTDSLACLTGLRTGYSPRRSARARGDCSARVISGAAGVDTGALSQRPPAGDRALSGCSAGQNPPLGAQASSSSSTAVEIGGCVLLAEVESPPGAVPCTLKQHWG